MPVRFTAGNKGVEVFHMAPYARWLWLWPCCKLFDAIVVELIEEPKSQQLKCCYHGENQEHVRRVHLGILSWVVRERSWTSDSEKVVVWGGCLAVCRIHPGKLQAQYYLALNISD